jgi:YHS domain-containing protein
MHGEFDNYDPIGIAAGARVEADCSLNWRDPDDGKLYCFSSGTSLEMFLELPHTHIEQARRAWASLSAQAP